MYAFPSYSKRRSSGFSRTQRAISPSAQSNRQAIAGDTSICSPIKQIWSYIQHELQGQKLAGEEALFCALQKAWNKIPNQEFRVVVPPKEYRLAIGVKVGASTPHEHHRMNDRINDR
jgi:hypothetical protein